MVARFVRLAVDNAFVGGIKTSQAFVDRGFSFGDGHVRLVASWHSRESCPGSFVKCW